MIPPSGRYLAATATVLGALLLLVAPADPVPAANVAIGSVHGGGVARTGPLPPGLEPQVADGSAELVADPSATVPFPIAVGGVQVAVRNVYYDVAGSNERELRAQMERFGPRAGSGGWAAATHWNLSWSYPFFTTDGQCAAGPPTVNLSVTYTYPRWSPPGGASRRLVDTWNRYLAAVAIHEAGHGQLATQAGHELFETLRALPVAASCAELDGAAQSAGRSIGARYTVLQTRYDQETKHGATQGASFP